MKKTLRVTALILKIILIAFTGILLFYNVYMLIARYAFKNEMPTLFGYSGAVVVSGSMAPTININDFIIIKSQDEYFPGDIITFFDSTRNEYVTHKILLVSNGMYATKGDANNTPDEFSVPHDAVIGKVVGVWRGFGKVIRFLQSPIGFFVVVGVGMVFWFACDLVGNKKRNIQHEREEN